MWTSGFFNSVNGDRVYNAQQMSRIFEGLITDGVYAAVGNKLAVQPNNGMTVQINTGKAWVGKHWVDNDSPYLLAVEASDVTLNRYAAVVIKADDTNAVRDAKPYIKYSPFASNPVKPAMTRTETVTERCLAYIYIKAGAAEITAADIEDTRGNTELCGWVTGLIEQLNTTTMFEQWTAIFNNWFGTLQDLINENTEAMLVNALPVSLKLTLTTGGWVSENGLYKQSVTVVGMNDTKTVIVSPTSTSASTYSASEVRCSSQSTNTLEFTAVSQPNNDIEVDVLHLGV